ncbi:MAG: HAMP domain-containing sensor histidine kinase [Roseovarius sp.]|uniref:sensor histidine kinase n=1 Tax=Roseovarius sp. TaxID=1486281 RepID=UPI0032EE9F13
MTRLSLRLRLAIAGAVATALALGLAGVGLVALFGTHVERRALAELSVHLDQVIAGLERRGDALVLVTPPADPRFARPYGGLYWQIEAGATDLRARSLWDYELPLPEDTPQDGAPHVHEVPGPQGGAVLVLERRVSLPDSLGGGAARAAVAMEAADLVQARRDFARDMTPYLALLALVLVAAGWAQLVVGLRPLRRLGARLSDLRRGDSARIGTDWPGEVQPLAAGMDALLAEREADIERARARAGDLAHGLKTPLQALMGETARLRDAGQGAAADAIESVADTMQRHVTRELARTRSAARARHARADVGQVVERVISVLRRTPEGGRIEWQVSGAHGLMAVIDESDLAEALGALAENAARHAVARVTVLVSKSDDGGVHLELADDGPGIPEARLADLMRRGTRLDESGPGEGLGLAIARDIVEGAGGRLRLENGAGGLRVTVVLGAG